MKVNKGAVSSKIQAGRRSTGYKESPLLFDSKVFIGIEIELENLDGFNCMVTQKLQPEWEEYHDHSLKLNGREFRFNNPLAGGDVIVALDKFSQCMQDTPNVYTGGNRGATHLHFNVSDLEISELFNVTLLSYHMEPILLSQCNQDRESNSFGVTSSHTKDWLVVLRAIAAGNLHFSSDTYKYRSIGLNSIYSKGSIEYRMFHATPNTSEVLKWINLGLEIRHVALKYTPEQLIELLSSSLETDVTTVTNQLFNRDIFSMVPQSRLVRTRSRMWDFIRTLAFNPIEDLELTTNVVSDFYKQVMGGNEV